MRTNYFFLSLFAMMVLFTNESIAASFTPGTLYMGHGDGIYRINEQNPNDRQLIISDAESTAGSSYRQLTFSYKDGYVDHMFVTIKDPTNSYYKYIKEYEADNVNPLRTWYVSTAQTSIRDMAVDIQNGTTQYLYLGYNSSSAYGYIDRIDLTTGIRSTVIEGGFNPDSLAFTIPQKGTTGNVWVGNGLIAGSIFELNPNTSAIISTITLDTEYKDIEGLDFGKDSEGKTTNFLYAAIDATNEYLKKYDVITRQQLLAVSAGACIGLAVKPTNGTASTEVLVLQDGYYSSGDKISRFSTDNLGSLGSVQNNIFDKAGDIVYVPYGWSGFEPQEPEPIVIPEPVSVLLMITGLIGLAVHRRKRA